MTTTTHGPISANDITEAYVYVLGRYLVIRQEAIDIAEPGSGYNVLKHNPPVNAGDTAGSAPTFVNPNLDVVYSEAWLAVDIDTPVILEIPEIPSGLYYTAQIVDEWAEITHNINDRNDPDHPVGRFAICLAGSTPTIPGDCKRIDIPSSKAKLLTRVELADDVERAVRLQHEFTVTSTGTPDITPLVAFPPFTNAALPGVAVFQQPQLDGALAAADACGRAAEMHPTIRAIAEFVTADPTNAEQVDAVIHETAIPAFMHFVMSFGTVIDGWSSTAAYPSFGDDYWFRATANFGGIWWNSSNEAVYEMLHTDAAGDTPTGDTTYTLRFEPDRTPETVAGAFWSLTIYGKPDYMLVPNPISRYNVSYRSGLVADDDGSITIHLAPEQPDGTPESNWLPTPAGRAFTADLRLYLPTSAVHTGAWNPPPLTPA